MPTQTAVKPFSLVNFRALYEQAPSRQYLSKMEEEQIGAALKDKNIPLLEALYKILLQEQSSDAEIARDFIMTKNRILDDCMIDMKDIENKYLAKPLKKKRARTEKVERKKAEALLKQL